MLEMRGRDGRVESPENIELPHEVRTDSFRGGWPHAELAIVIGRIVPIYRDRRFLPNRKMADQITRNRPTVRNDYFAPRVVESR